MLHSKQLLLLAATALSAQVQLKYLDLGPQPAPCCTVTDANGNTYVAAAYATSKTTAKIVVFKVNSANNTVYRLIFGGSVNDNPRAISVDANGNLFVAGSTDSPDFPLVKPIISNGPLAQSTGGDSRGFVAKIGPTGTLVFSTFLGGMQSDAPSEVDAITLDAAGDVYVTGGTMAADFPITSGAYAKIGNAFVTKITNAGDRILLSTLIGSGGTGLAIAVDSEGAITVAGSAGDAGGFPASPGAFQTACNCGSVSVSPLGSTSSYAPSFILRLTADASHLVWSTYLGSNGTTAGPNAGLTQDTVSALALTSDGGVVVAGLAQSPDFAVTTGAFQTKFRAQSGQGIGANLFVTRLNGSGTALKFSTFLGGSVLEQFNGLQLDAQEHPWVTGTTLSPDFPVLAGDLALGSEFVVELAVDGSKLLGTQMLPYGAAGAAFTLGASGSETLLGASGSLIRIPADGLSGLSILAQVNAAGHAASGRVAPGEIISLYGTSLGPAAGASAQLNATGRIATALAGVQVTCDGIPAPLLYVGANQINAVVPFEVSGRKSTAVQVTTNSATSTLLYLTVAPASPQIFSIPVPLQFYEDFAVALNADGTVNSLGNPAHAGSAITFWVNGPGLFSPSLSDGAIVESPLAAPVAPVSVLLDSQPLEFEATAALSLVAGPLQVSATLPQNAAAGLHSLSVQTGTLASKPVEIAVQPD